MRDFTDMTIIPNSAFISVDGEGYHCDPFALAGIKGSTRTIPGDSVLAIHWFGQHDHGQIEAIGAVEGFVDRGQVEQYFKPWLKARAKAKQERADRLSRKRSIEQQMIVDHENIKEIIAQQIASLASELDAASADRRAQVQAMLDVAHGQMKIVSDALSDVQRRLTSAEEIAAAMGEASESHQDAS